MRLVEKIRTHEPVLLYGLTPPRIEKSENEVKEMADRTLSRLSGVRFDGLVIYDLQDESARSPERPFEFSGCYAPERFYREFLRQKHEAVIYRAVSNLTEESFVNFIKNADFPLVLVGSASSSLKPTLSLQRAYEMKKEHAKSLLLGGIAISERHAKKGREEHRIAQKVLNGCEFFITQAVFDLSLAKRFIDDLSLLSIKKPPLVFTFTPVGSRKTLEFVRWLGVSVPAFVEEQIFGEGEEKALEKSMEFCLKEFRFLRQYGMEKGVCVGANVESVSGKKAEILGSIELLRKFGDSKFGVEAKREDEVRISASVPIL